MKTYEIKMYADFEPTKSFGIVQASSPREAIVKHFGREPSDGYESMIRFIGGMYVAETID